MQHLIHIPRRAGILVICLQIALSFGLPLSTEANAQEAGMQMVFGDRSIAMPLPKDRLVVRSKYPFMDTVIRIKETIESKDLLIVGNTDHQELLKLVGLKTGGMLGIEFFHPRYGKVIAKNDGAAALEMPFRIVVMEANDGSVLVTYYRPSSVLAPYKGCEGLGREIDGVLDEIVASFTR
ncbi:MAG: DUF302 domain-containing protein [Nitrospirales bacterium]|nr:DUF302 domain-containing protein [Nitrospirales bacterium]HNP30275.1 DUF302 domain-containing protein [Nitrospirales bacterium]